MKHKVLQVQGGMNKGGLEAVIMGWYRNIDLNELQFDFTTLTKEECPYDKEILEKGGRIIYVPSRQDVGNIKHCYYLYKCIKENGPYMAVHSHMNFHGGIVAIIAKLAGVKNVISHAHNTKDDGVGLKRKIEIFILQKLLLLFSDKLIACGIDAGNFVFGSKSKFKVINNAVDNEVFKPIDDKLAIKKIKKELNIKEEIILGHIGRFTEQKNHKYIIKIINELKNKNFKFKLILIGDGALKEEVLNEFKVRNIDKYVIYLGLQDDINKYMNIMDLFIFPSLYEGLPVVLVEAQSTGLPCIVSDKITKDVDLGLGLIEFLSIDNDVDLWVEKIIQKRIRKLYNKDMILECLKSKGYSLFNTTHEIVNIYKNNKYQF